MNVMALFGQSMKTILFLKSQSLEVYTAGKKVVLNFPENIVKNQEVLDARLLSQIIADGIKQIPKKSGDAILILSNEVLYQKTVPNTDFNAEKFEINKFLDEIPFENPNIAFIKIKDEANLSLFAANKPFFYEVKNLFTKFGFKLQAVVPAHLYGITNEITKPEELERIQSDTAPLQNGNFLESQDPSNVEDISLESKPHSYTKLFIFIVTLFFVVLIVGGLWIFQNKYAKTSNIPSPSSSPLPTASPVAKEAEKPTTLDKKDLKLVVLNGTKVPGQAGKLKDKLAEFGFENVETGSTDEVATNTLVLFDQKVSEEQKAEIEKILNEFFVKIIIQEATESAQYNIAIETGQQSKKF